MHKKYIVRLGNLHWSNSVHNHNGPKKLILQNILTVTGIYVNFESIYKYLYVNFGQLYIVV